MISADGQQRDFGPAIAADVFETIKVSAVTGVVNSPALMLEHEATVSTMTIAQDARAPMFARCQSHRPIAVRKAFPPFEFDDAAKTEIVRQVAHAPGHQGDFRMRQPAQTWFVKVIEV